MAPVLCVITDRNRAGADWNVTLPARVRAAAAAGVRIIQIRERDLEAGALLALARRCVAAVHGTPARVVINDRLDIALAAGAHGVHLRGDSVSAAAVRVVAPRPFLVGRSIHSRADAIAAAADGLVDYLLFGTVFESGSKPGGQPAGLEALAAVAAAVPVPVLAVGGVTRARLPSLLAAGAAGGAGISLLDELTD